MKEEGLSRNRAQAELLAARCVLMAHGTGVSRIDDETLVSIKKMFKPEFERLAIELADLINARLSEAWRSGGDVRQDTFLGELLEHFPDLDTVDRDGAELNVNGADLVDHMTAWVRTAARGAERRRIAGSMATLNARRSSSAAADALSEASSETDMPAICLECERTYWPVAGQPHPLRQGVCVDCRTFKMLEANVRVLGEQVNAEHIKLMDLQQASKVALEEARRSNVGTGPSWPDSLRRLEEVLRRQGVNPRSPGEIGGYEPPCGGAPGSSVPDGGGVAGASGPTGGAGPDDGSDLHDLPF